MAPVDLPVGAKGILSHQGLQALIDALAARGYQVLGPTVRDGAIVYAEVSGIADLPAGWTDRQDAGRYRLERRADTALFGYAVGPQSWKRFLHPPIERLWQARAHGRRLHRDRRPRKPQRNSPFSACEPANFTRSPFRTGCSSAGHIPNTGYQRRRQDNFFIAVNCGEAGGTCFCVSMKTGPKAQAGFDLALTELLDGGDHRFLVEVGSAAGGAVLAELPHRPAVRRTMSAAAAAVVARTAGQMGRTLDTDGLKELLQSNPTHPRWDDVAQRCLGCANCTMVCPTCFCTTVDDHSDLAGQTTERVRSWDSCFTLDFSYIHGGRVRTETRSRYRQWMTHKLASWIDQFGTSGCVGCGRCITWCPVGIDITAEAAAIREPEETDHGRA